VSKLPLLDDDNSVIKSNVDQIFDIINGSVPQISHFPLQEAILSIRNCRNKSLIQCFTTGVRGNVLSVTQNLQITSKVCKT